MHATWSWTRACQWGGSDKRDKTRGRCYAERISSRMGEVASCSSCMRATEATPVWGRLPKQRSTARRRSLAAKVRRYVTGGEILRLCRRERYRARKLG
jgi:hypothetical protein